jgi:hypothetical protein
VAISTHLPPPVISKLCRHHPLRGNSGAASRTVSPSPLRRRAAKAENRRSPNCGYERFEFLGRICRPIPQHPASLSRPRALEIRPEGADAGGCQRSNRPWRPRQAVKVWCHQLWSNGNPLCCSISVCDGLFSHKYAEFTRVLLRSREYEYRAAAAARALNPIL